MSPVFISNVDDYVAPSQACVNPLFSESVADESTISTTLEKKKQSTTATNPAADNNGGLIIRKKRRPTVRRKRPVPPSNLPSTTSSTTAVSLSTITTNNNFGLLSTTTKQPKQEVAKVTMADCLACSGCVTSAETVLVEQHSLKTLEKKLAETTNTDTTVVFTISPAAWADLLRQFEISVGTNKNNNNMIKRRITTALQQACRASIVLDGSIPLQWSLVEAAHEFCDAFLEKNSTPNKENVPLPLPLPSMALSSTESQIYGKSTVTTHTTRSRSLLPLVSSSCPALVCWIEKSQAALVPHLSTAKSPMAMAGTFFSSIQQQNFLHVAIMPCHDKKLEASRKDFSTNNKQEVDLVLTTKEWFQLLQKNAEGEDVKAYIQSLEPAKSVSSLHPVVTNSFTTQDPVVAVLLEQESDHETDEKKFDTDLTQQNKPKQKLFPHGSGGYADFIFRYAARQLFGYDTGPSDQPLPWKSATGTSSVQSTKMSARVAALRKRQQLYSMTLYQITPTNEYSLTYQEGAKVVLSFAVAHGFQTLQRVLGSNTTTTTTTAATLKYDYIEAMACPSACVNGGGQIPLVERETPKETRQRVKATQTILGRDFSNQPKNRDIYDTIEYPFSLEAQSRLHTRYHVVPPFQHTTGAVAGVAVTDTQW